MDRRTDTDRFIDTAPHTMQVVTKIIAAHEMNRTELTCNKSTQLGLHDAFTGHARLRHLIGRSETRTLGAQSVCAL